MMIGKSRFGGVSGVSLVAFKMGCLAFLSKIFFKIVGIIVSLVSVGDLEF